MPRPSQATKVRLRRRLHAAIVSEYLESAAGAAGEVESIVRTPCARSTPRVAQRSTRSSRSGCAAPGEDLARYFPPAVGTAERCSQGSPQLNAARQGSGSLAPPGKGGPREAWECLATGEDQATFSSVKQLDVSTRRGDRCIDHVATVIR